MGSVGSGRGDDLAFLLLFGFLRFRFFDVYRGRNGVDEESLGLRLGACDDGRCRCRVRGRGGSRDDGLDFSRSFARLGCLVEDSLSIGVDATRDDGYHSFYDGDGGGDSSDDGGGRSRSRGDGWSGSLSFCLLLPLLRLVETAITYESVGERLEEWMGERD